MLSEQTPESGGADAPLALPPIPAQPPQHLSELKELAERLRVLAPNEITDRIREIVRGL